MYYLLVDELAAIGLLAHSAADVSDNDLTGTFGIMGTPVIDLAKSALYLVAATKESDSSYVYRLHAIDLASGSERAASPVQVSAVVAGHSLDAFTHMQRPGLLLIGGTVYIAFGSYGDVGTYWGWVLGYDTTTLTQVAAFNTAPDSSQSAIWMSGAGPAADSSGNIYLATANGPFDAGDTLPPTPPQDDFGDSVVKLSTSGGLAVSDFFTPNDQASLSSNDWDLGSGGVVVLPDAVGSSAHPHLALAGDKESKLFLIDRDNMGRYTPGGPDNIVQTLLLNSQGGCADCGMYSTASVSGNALYVGAVDENLRLYRISGASIDSQPASQSSEVYAFPGTNPVITAAGTSNPVVWGLDTNANGSPNGDSGPLAPAVLRAYDATDLTTTLWSSDANGADAGGNAVRFVVPTVANGKVYVGGADQLTVYGLLPSAPPGLIGSPVRGAEYDATARDVFSTSTNYFVTQAPSSGSGNAGGVTTVSVSASSVEFASVSGGGSVAAPGTASVTADFSASTLTITETVSSAAPPLAGFQLVFTDPQFSALAVTKIADSFANGGFSAQLNGSTLTLTVGPNCTVSAGCSWPVGTSTAQFSLMPATGAGTSGSAPLPLWALLALGATLLTLASRQHWGAR